jgi:multidrug resistance efflux pump
VRAPIGGIIVSKNAIRGQQVNPGRAATEQFRRQFEDRRRPYAG